MHRGKDGQLSKRKSALLVYLYTIIGLYMEGWAKLPGWVGILAADHGGNAGLPVVPHGGVGDVSTQEDDRLVEHLKIYSIEYRQLEQGKVDMVSHPLLIF